MPRGGATPSFGGTWFDKGVARAISDVEEARQQIVEAKDAVDIP